MLASHSEAVLFGSQHRHVLLKPQSKRKLNVKLNAKTIATGDKCIATTRALLLVALPVLLEAELSLHLCDHLPSSLSHTLHRQRGEPVRNHATDDEEGLRREGAELVIRCDSAVKGVPKAVHTENNCL